MSTTLKKSFPAGTLVKWSASAENFHTSSGVVFLNEDTTLNIELKDSKISFEWDGGGTKTVYFGDKQVTSTSPICVGDDGPMTGFFAAAFSSDSTTKNVFINAEGLPSNNVLSNLFNYDTNAIENIEIINSSHITDFTGVFANMKHIKTLSVDTSGATTLEELFSHSAIVNAPFLETSNVINTGSMFLYCSNLEYIPLYDFSNVTNMNRMFQGCSKLTTLPQLDTHNVTDTSYMFYDVFNLTTIPQLDTHNVTNMSWMFQGCEKLTTLPQLDTSNVTSMGGCFWWCRSLKNVGGFIGLKVSVDFGQCPLTHESALNIIDNLAVSSGHSVRFMRSTFKSLTSAEIARATDKGWKIESV